jgi:hypothetical protein
VGPISFKDGLGSGGHPNGYDLGTLAGIDPTGTRIGDRVESSTKLLESLIYEAHSGALLSAHQR